MLLTRRTARTLWEDWKARHGLLKPWEVGPRCRVCGYSLDGLQRIYGQCFCPECDAVTRVEPKRFDRLIAEATAGRKVSLWRRLVPLALMTAPCLIIAGLVLSGTGHFLAFIVPFAASILLPPLLGSIVLQLLPRRRWPAGLCMLLFLAS